MLVEVKKRKKKQIKNAEGKREHAKKDDQINDKDYAERTLSYFEKLSTSGTNCLH